MRDNSDSVIIRAPIDAKSLNELRGIAGRLNTNLIDVFSQALKLFMIAQGRRVILKEKDNDDNQWEITDYRDQKPILPIKGT